MESPNCHRFTPAYSCLEIEPISLPPLYREPCRIRNSGSGETSDLSRHWDPFFSSCSPHHRNAAAAGTWHCALIGKRAPSPQHLALFSCTSPFCLSAFGGRGTCTSQQPPSGSLSPNGQLRKARANSTKKTPTLQLRLFDLAAVPIPDCPLLQATGPCLELIRRILMCTLSSFSISHCSDRPSTPSLQLPPSVTAHHPMPPTLRHTP